MRIQFICKKNETYGFTSYTKKSSGLYNSTKFIVDALKARGVHAEIIEVLDNNDIDREVTRFRPDVVVIEALWVTPSKFDVLKSLHPGVSWFVHLHSNIPFIAMEGIAIEWLRGYAARHIGIIVNSPEAFENLEPLGECNLIYLPNVYLGKMLRKPDCAFDYRTWIDVGCFGAIRPLKNHLLQALAAIKFAEDRDKRLRFHVNGSRVETNGDPVLKNLVSLFENTEHELVLCPWFEQDEFIQYLYDRIDVGLQVSLSETFNVVTANYVTAGLPVVVSKEVKWVSDWCKASDDSVDEIVCAMERVCGWGDTLIWWNQKLLTWYSEKSQKAWFNFCHKASRRNS